MTAETPPGSVSDNAPARAIAVCGAIVPVTRDDGWVGEVFVPSHRTLSASRSLVRRGVVFRAAGSFEASSSRCYTLQRTPWRTLELFSASHYWLFSDAHSRAPSKKQPLTAPSVSERAAASVTASPEKFRIVHRRQGRSPPHLSTFITWMQAVIGGCTFMMEMKCYLASPTPPV